MTHVLALALVLRIVVPLLAYAHARDGSVFQLPDTPEYVQLAVSLSHGSFKDSDGNPELFRTPGYPALLLPGVLLNSVEPVGVALQIALGVWSVYLVYRLTLLVLDDRRAAMLASWLYAIDLQAILYCSTLTSETLFAALIIVFLLALLTYFKNGSLPPASAASVALVAAIYTRPQAGYLLLPLVALWILFGVGRGVTLRDRLRAGIAFVLIGTLFLVPWHVRNWRMAHTASFSNSFAVNLYWFHTLAIESELSGQAYHQVVEERNPGAVGNLDTWQILRESVLRHPLLFARLQVKGMVWAAAAPNTVLIGKLLGLNPDTRTDAFAAAYDKDVSQSVRFTSSVSLGTLLWSAAMVLQTLLCYALAWWGYRSAGGWRNRHLTALLFIAAYFFVISGGQVASGRLRHPAMPILYIAAGIGLASLLGSKPEAQSELR